MDRRGFSIISLMATCIALNAVFGSIIFLLKLPIYLDSIGIMLCALIYPGTKTRAFTAASIVGIVSYLAGVLWGNASMPLFIGTAIVGAAFGSFIVRPLLMRGGRIAEGSLPKTTATTLGLGIAWGVLAAIASAPVVVLVFQGVTASGTAFVIELLRRSGQQLVNAALLAGFAAEPIDKTLQMFAAVTLARATPNQFLEYLGWEPSIN